MHTGHITKYVDLKIYLEFLQGGKKTKQLIKFGKR